MLRAGLRQLQVVGHAAGWARAALGVPLAVDGPEPEHGAAPGEVAGLDLELAVVVLDRRTTGTSGRYGSGVGVIVNVARRGPEP